MAGPKRILISGATGTVGSSVLSQLLDRKRSSPDFAAALRVGVRSPEKMPALEPASVEVTRMDYSDKESLKRALVGVDSVFLVFPVAMNVLELATNVFEACVEAGVKHIVKISEWDIDVLARSLDFYVEEQKVERLLTESKIPTTRLHPTNYMENFYKFYNAPHTIRTEDAFHLAFGSGRVSFIDTRDVAAVAVKMLTTPGDAGKAHTLTGVSVTMDEVAASFSRALGRTIRYVPLPLDEAKKAWLAAGLPGWLVHTLVHINDVFSRSVYDAMYPDLEEILGRKALTFDDFIRDRIDLFR